ncbi:unnamed protein product [Brugia pahangi]|uniref:Uncharacterized protein n=1 Tax=Brugia pahangi TaxID=6280 RepID=A0A0N4T9S4_BRUPA|nr:unnamed protein product [Brugia pahangi]
MWYEIIFILAMITYHQLYIQSSTITATFGYHFMIIFPSNNGNKNINPTISVTLMNPNDKQVTVQIENVKNANDFLDDSEIITVNIDAMNYAEVSKKKEICQENAQMYFLVYFKKMRKCFLGLFQENAQMYFRFISRKCANVF